MVFQPLIGYLAEQSDSDNPVNQAHAKS